MGALSTELCRLLEICKVKVKMCKQLQVFNIINVLDDNIVESAECPVVCFISQVVARTCLNFQFELINTK